MPESLTAYVAEKKRQIFADLERGQSPSEGSFDAELLKEAQTKQAPRMGTTRFEPRAIIVEYVYNDPSGSTLVVPVTLPAPERIVFMPVPDWVKQTIWQGEISGTFCFESEAASRLAAFASLLEPETNADYVMNPDPAMKRES